MKKIVTPVTFFIFPMSYTTIFRSGKAVSLIIKLNKNLNKFHTTLICFSFREENHIRFCPFYLSPKGLICRGLADAPTVPTKDPHREVGGMIRPASSAILSKEEFSQTVPTK